MFYADLQTVRASALHYKVFIWVGLWMLLKSVNWCKAEKYVSRITKYVFGNGDP